jgi:hypothetical protein
MPAKARTDRELWHVRMRLKRLEDWITLGEAARHLSTSRQAVHRLVERGSLEARIVGERPVILVRLKDVRALPVSPQRKRELQLKGLLPPEPELGDELPEG